MSKLVYFCPNCLSVEVHVGSLLSQCKDWYGRWGRPKCTTWTIAVGKYNSDGTVDELKGRHIDMLPEGPQP